MATSKPKLKQAIVDTALTALYLVTFPKWMFDDTKDSQSASRFLKNRLDSTCRLIRFEKVR